jgi:hypothetical protein
MHCGYDFNFVICCVTFIREKEAEKLNERAAVANPQEVVSMVEMWVPSLTLYILTINLASCNNYIMQLTTMSLNLNTKKNLAL